MGQLIYFLELVTAYMGELLDIDAFNQPGVEQSKQASYAVLGSESAKHAEMAEDIQHFLDIRNEYIL
jgi:glucose-6-phosphate isomerase